MIYAIACLLKGPVEDYHHKLVDEIANKFGLKITKEENLDTHFTLKYEFETNNIEEIEKVCEDFCKTHKKTSVRVGGFDNFKPKVVFISVNLSKEAKKTFLEFVSVLKKIEWMCWEKYETKNLHFHSTIAEECNNKYDNVWSFVKGKEKYFDCWFDNVTIFKEISRKGNICKCKIHKAYTM